MFKCIFLSLLLLMLSACDQVNQKLGLEDSAKKEASMQAEGKAVGSACRQSGRAIEDCYSIYNWLPKAPIYEGWKEMDAYMRENQLETVAPQLPPPESPAAAKKRKKAEAAAGNAEGEGEKSSEKASAKEEDKHAAKGDEKNSAKSDEKGASKAEEKSPAKSEEKSPAKH